MPEVAISRLADAQVADTKYEATHIEVAELDSDIASDSGSVNSKSEDASSNGTRRSSLASRTSTLDLNASHLISSPYPDFENQLKLEGLDTPHQLFAFALTTLRPVRVDYATAPYLESFNWSEVFSFLRALCERTGHEWQETSFYTVIFRSTLLEGIDREELGRLDQKSHEEACASGGLLKYWFGSCDDQRRNLATCKYTWKHQKKLPLICVQVFGGATTMLLLVAQDLNTRKREWPRAQCISRSASIHTNWW